jgi:hypothetical protein
MDVHAFNSSGTEAQVPIQVLTQDGFMSVTQWLLSSVAPIEADREI